MKPTLRNTFTKVAILTYCLGMLAHIVVLVTGRPGSEMPNVVHWAVTVLAGYSGWGFIVNLKRVPFVNFVDKVLYWLVLIHLLSSALIHAYSIIRNTNDWLTLFGYTYSYFAVAYFFIFGYYSFLLDKRLRKI